jgi:hypothetical protein
LTREASRRPRLTLPLPGGTSAIVVLGASMVLACVDSSLHDDEAELVADAWETAIDTTLPAGVTRIRVGHLGASDNFANRGGVEVRHDAEPGTIRVELRRFAWGSAAQAEELFADLHLWAYATQTPVAPGPSLSDLDCATGWRDDCLVTVWFDGYLQPLRAGADLRVHLPPDFEGDIDLVTEDLALPDATTPRFSDVVVQGLRGTVSVDLGSGATAIRLAPEIEVAPACTAEDNATCAAADWQAPCDCAQFGFVRVAPRGPLGAPVTIDAPASLWLDVCLENTASPQIEATCTATVACDDFDDCAIEEETGPPPWKLAGALNLAGEGDGGFEIFATASACTLHEGAARGGMHLCSGCLAEDQGLGSGRPGGNRSTSSAPRI